MAEVNISVHWAHFICPVCLDLLKDPVGLYCGHNFCTVCINGWWNQEDGSRGYSCPQCRDTFTPRPVLRRNNMLAGVVETLKKNKDQAASPVNCYAGPVDVACDFCTGRKRKAVKSCLTCVASFCETHLKSHYEVPFWKKHMLVEALINLKEIVCSKHDKVLKIYCRTYQSFICYLCMIDQHKGHNDISVKLYTTEKQRELQQNYMKFQQRIQKKQKENLKQVVDTIKLSAQTAVEDKEIAFTEMISFIDKKCSEVMELFRGKEKAEQLLEQLDQIVDLQRRVTEIEQLSRTHLQNFQSLCISSVHEDSPSITVNQNFSVHGMRKFLSDLTKIYEEFCQGEISKISELATVLQMSFPSEPNSREDFMHYFCDLTLDPNTINYNLILSENNRVATYSLRKQPYPDHPERFDCYSQVLCKESVYGRCYWEVEWSTEGWVEISVAYKGLSRKGRGNEALFGFTDQSWSLCCFHIIGTDHRVPSSSRIGVYVDHSAGTLSFYSVSDTMKLLHRVHNTFTEPLYAGFWLCSYPSSVRLCNQNK